MDLISPCVDESSLRAAQPKSTSSSHAVQKEMSRRLELARIECEDLVGWRQLVHVSQVLLEKGDNLRARHIVQFYAQHVEASSFILSR